MSLGRLSGHKTKAQQVYERLREAIYTGDLKPGATLVISALAERLEVSEIPVREALQRLKHDELVEIIPYTGTIVSPIILERVRQSLETRAILEGYACRLATPLMDQDDLVRLEASINEMDECILHEDMRRYSQVNRTFHLLIMQRCPNVRTRQILEQLLGESERARAIFMVKAGHASISNQEHKAILTYVKAKEADAAEAIMRAHQLRVAREFASLEKEALL